MKNFIKINEDFFSLPTLTVCKNLIGCKLVCDTDNGVIEGTITEIEGYLGVTDKACHTYGNKKTQRTKVMYEKGGTLYIYFVYGMHYNVNFVTEGVGTPTAILLRGIKITKGQDIASMYRYGKPFEQLTNYQKTNLSNGPGKVAKALNLTKNQNNLPFTSVFEIYKPTNAVNYKTDKRIGINYAGTDKDLPYRFILLN